MKENATEKPQYVTDAWWRVGSAQSDLEIAREATDMLTALVVEGSLSDGGTLDSSAFAVFMLGISSKMGSALSDIAAAMRLLDGSEGVTCQ